MRYLIYIFLFCAALVNAQDRLVYNDGSVKKGSIVSIGKDIVFFRVTDTSTVQRIKKSDLILAEDYKGTRYVFASKPVADTPEGKPVKTTELYRNNIGIVPLGLFLGRATVAYERLTDDGKMGIVFPLSLTFNPYAPREVDTVFLIRKRGINFLGGVDVNFYMKVNERSHFFIGPRFRYGTDVFLLNTQLWTAQTQCGWKYEDPNFRFTHHLSLGFGFMKMIASTGFVTARRTFACYSLNYRLGIKW